MTITKNEIEHAATEAMRKHRRAQSREAIVGTAIVLGVAIVLVSLVVIRNLHTY